MRVLLISALLLLSLAGASSAETYPAKPIRVIVPFPAGGGTDIIARLTMTKAAEVLGGRVVIDNRGGAGGTSGTEALANSPPDGYTFGVVSASHAVNPALYERLSFDP